MRRRDFLYGLTAAGASFAALDGPVGLGINTYCLRAMRWNDSQLLDYCAGLRLDAIFLQDSLDPKRNEPAHWAWVKQRAAELRLHLETGGGGILPKTRDAVPAEVEKLRHEIRRAKAMGSPIVRCLLASDREHLPVGSIDQHTETAVSIFRSVRSECIDNGLKIGLEVHKDLQAWEMRRLIETAGKDLVGSYLDTGNPVFVMEDPLETVETLAPLAVTVHLRDSVVYMHPKGVAVQWVPLGEGLIDFRRIIERVRALATGVHIYVKPITGRPPTILPIYDRKHWDLYPDAKAKSLVRFLALARAGKPFEGHMVIEDLPGRQTPQHFLEAIQFQQRDHVERGVAYARNTLGLGRRSAR